MKKIINSLLLVSLVFSIIIFSGCGKHETATGTVGAASGAIIGTALAGDKNKGTGALLGALIGSSIGRSIGQIEDKEEEHEKRAEEKLYHKREIQALKNENRALKQDLQKWCPSCSHRIKLLGAATCPDCGVGLITEKMCARCNRTFAPEAQYKYCPYCNVKVCLQNR